MPQAALYARVSTRNQEKEATIESQLALVDAYAQTHGYTIAEPHRFIDEAVSGSRLARPGLDRLRDAAKAQAFTVVLCLEPARLARNLGVQQVVLEELKRWGHRRRLRRPTRDGPRCAQPVLAATAGGGGRVRAHAHQ